MSNLSALESERLFGLTGHTDDLGEALDQWENERQGMVELYEVTKRQDQLLQRLRHDWDILRLTLWGKDDQPDPLNPRPLSTTALEKVTQAIAKLDSWNTEAATCCQDAQAADAQWHQLVLQLNNFAKEANHERAT